MVADPDYLDDSESSTGGVPAGGCEDDRCDDPQLPIWHCVDCDSSYCSDCWPRQGPHRRNKKGRDGVPHEKTNPLVVQRLKAILHPTKKPEEIQRLHEEDESTKWFGVTRDLTGRPTLDDYGRYATLMASISPIESMGNRYPQLVSFIGVTNAGKSTLIKLLIDHNAESNKGERRVLFPSPIVGSVVNDSVPTSGDVHLYADPATHAEQLPILFADCEGFEGGERTPLGARARRGARFDQSKDNPSKVSHVHSRPIEWANTEESRQREYAVTALYPRLLYTFSDCVVFVLRNAKTFQSAVLTKLLDWGVAALEKSINQPALPHCIVALNGTDPGVDEREWDVDFATQSLLSSVKGALDYVEGVPRFRELAEYWRSLGKHIFTVEDLILRYYSSFKVVRIPSKPRYMTIHQQIGKMHEMIKSNCEDSFRTKRRARMLTNADELNVYLQSGFDHFTNYLNVPFNFMQISLLRNPIPNDFGGHILQLCTTISTQQPNHQPGRVAWIFERLSVMLSSCVLLDCARFRKGRVDELFANYEKFFDYAMGEYLELHYPCSYVNPDGTRSCQLVRARHAVKGHQDEKGIIATGDYEAAFDSTFLPQWKAQLRAAIESIHRDFSYELEQASNEDTHAIPEEKIALDLHAEYLNQFYESIGPAAAICSHATCFCCLMDVPEHPLPCGHVLCTACIKAYGKQEKSLVSLTCCPLHRESTKWAKPALVRFKPNGAGVRICCLDSGGIRGIVQLEVLHAIEQALGGFLPVQAFFDLIVGTGTGGLVAVALSMKHRTVDSCTDMFKAICDHAFTPRLKGVPIITQLAQVFGSGPKYKTKPLYSALKTAFSEDDELFGNSGRLRTGVKVAVTSTSVTERESILLASYRRPEDLVPSYSFERPHEPEMELKTWQCVAAALATPSYFKPFNFHAKTYLDGGLRSSNPASIADRERRLIWPDVGEPDLFLSIGTGQNRITVLQKLSDRPKEAAPTANNAPQPGHSASESRKSSGKWRPRRTDDVLEAEIAWSEFRAHAVKDRSEAKARRFIRFNPDLDREPPSLDNKNEIETLQNNVRKRLQTPHRLAALRNVGHRLVASSFYFDLQAKATADKGEQLCSGVITCRFEDGSMEMCALGKVLEQTCTPEFTPYFFLRPDYLSSEFASRIPITEEVIRGMIDNAIFGLPNVAIPLKDDTKSTSITLFLSPHDGLEPDGFPISGFPRLILGEPALSRARRPDRKHGSVEQPLQSPDLRHVKNRSDGDSISLNGPAHVASRSNSSDESWHDTQSRISPYIRGSNTPKMSLSDLIAQHQSSGSSIRQRTNRFWTYIGNNHMAQHPDMYSSEELARFAGTSAPRPAELASPMESPAPVYPGSTTSLQSTLDHPPEQHPHELDAGETPTHPAQEFKSVAATRQGVVETYSPSQPKSPRSGIFLHSSIRSQAPPMPGIKKTDSVPVRSPSLPQPLQRHHSDQARPARQSREPAASAEQASPPRPEALVSHPVRSTSLRSFPPKAASPREREPEPSGAAAAADEDDSDAEMEVAVAVAQKRSVVQLPALPAPREPPGPRPDPTPLETAIETALPAQSSVSALDKWLASQRKRKAKLNAVNEEAAEDH